MPGSLLFVGVVSPVGAFVLDPCRLALVRSRRSRSSRVSTLRDSCQCRRSLSCRMASTSCLVDSLGIRTWSRGVSGPLCAARPCPRGLSGTSNPCQQRHELLCCTNERLIPRSFLWLVGSSGTGMGRRRFHMSRCSQSSHDLVPHRASHTSLCPDQLLRGCCYFPRRRRRCRHLRYRCLWLTDRFLDAGSAIFIIGNLMSDHGNYQVELDGESTLFNGTAHGLVQESLLFFKAGLDPSALHRLTLRNADSKYFDVQKAVIVNVEFVLLPFELFEYH